jgi:hypothetical protein
VSERALDELAQALERGGEPDDVLRRIVAILAAEPGIRWAGIAFLEEGELALGPQAGEQDAERRIRVPVEFQAEPVGELWVDGEADTAFLERVAALVSAHVLIGWNTRGTAWDP